MRISLFRCFIFSAVLVAALLISAANAGGDEFSWMPVKSQCNGSIADCIDAEGELEMDSESNRRILATTKYISYGALKANNVPCSRRGASYYNCRPGAQANPYTRGCSAITRCRS
ncbi:rapid alkalinization factor-like [Olea europaea var. sylvestris]|uniref:rapid alkalinization factor-like n=1 Tax=Olea europaea var. sylvestris TaxID=158386 RepID=UPI000C1CF9AA|nr:rapid alkalinization factor-like [Olea europaea var. sylvestris]